MSVFHNNALIGASGQGGYQIERSLRFNSADSAYLVNSSTRTVAVGAYTFSFWIKRCDLSSPQRIWSSQDASGASNKWSTVLLGADDKLYFYHYSAADIDAAQSNGVLRDPSAWYHIVFSKPASAVGTLYINGVAQTKQTSYTTDADAFANAKYIGRNYDGTGYSNCYLTEFYGIDGQALTPSSFGETNLATGVWQPKKYTGTYGTNGFYLKFADNSGTTSTTLGKDSSGNSNNWTPNNFSVTAGAGNDSLIDVPTPYSDGGNGRGNYCTLNPLTKSASPTPSDGNLVIAFGGTYPANVLGSIGVSSGKWYWEVLFNGGNSTNGHACGVAVAGWANLNLDPVSYSTPYSHYVDSRQYFVNNSVTTNNSTSFTDGDIIGVALNVDSNQISFYKNGTIIGSAQSLESGQTWFPFHKNSSYTSLTQTANFGQRAFAYTPPSGFKALNTQNLPEPSIKKPSSYMDVKLYTGTAGTLTVTGLGFSPDLVWIKGRNAATTHVIQDTVRGATAYLSSNSTAAENTNTANDWFRAFTSDGFTVAATTSGGTPTSEWNNNGSTYVAWCWDESATPGFDIVTYTGDGTTSANRLIDHSLGTVPSFVITKKRSGGTDYGWSCWHKDLGGNYGIWLDKTNARNVNMWAGYSNFSATKFTPPDLLYGNESGATYVNYLWSEVAGFSKFGSYTGNGSTDGPFVHLGFKPAFVMIKRTDVAQDWTLFDNERLGYNPQTALLFPNGAYAESVYFYMDLLSNGFKIRYTSAEYNASGGTYIFAAFAETPFKSSLAR